MRAFTIGHSTHPLDAFVALLTRNGVTRIADVRRTPASRRHPQFNRETLGEDLARDGIDYRHLPALGGRRRARPDSPNGGWEHPAFRGYAAAWATGWCQGVRMRGPVAVIATVNSKCAASEPSCA